MGGTKLAERPGELSGLRRFGEPAYSRRLTDKILAAFNHAYAIGEREIAKELRAVLESVERKTRKASKNRRRTDSPLGEADLWMAFVEARDRYNWVAENRASDPEAVNTALEEMKEAYRRWSYS